MLREDRLISDIMEIAEILKIEGFLVTMDIEKTFDSLDHKFLIYALEEYSFGKNFITWVKTLLRNQESCALNGSTTTKRFLIRRGTRQGDPISAYLFLALEILFKLIKSKPEIKRLTIFGHCYLDSTYADDTTFFLQETISIKHIVDDFFIFFVFFWINTKLTKI